MAITKIVLDRQATARLFTFGLDTASNEGLVEIKKGTQATSYISFINRASVQIDGNLTVGGNITYTGTIDAQSVTNTKVADKTMTLNSGGTTAGAVGSGVIVEGDSATVIGQIAFDNSTASKFKAGNGTTNYEIITDQHTQTLQNKTVNATNNTITDTGAATGALLKYNGTKFVQFAKGSANQYLKVNAGGTDLEFATLASSPTFKRIPFTGTQDGSNKVFTLSSAPTVTDSDQVYLNGQLLDKGATNDYTLSGTTLTFTASFDSPLSTDKLVIFGSY